MSSTFEISTVYKWKFESFLWQNIREIICKTKLHKLHKLHRGLPIQNIYRMHCAFVPLCPGHHSKPQQPQANEIFSCRFGANMHRVLTQIYICWFAFKIFYFYIYIFFFCQWEGSHVSLRLAAGNEQQKNVTLAFLPCFCMCVFQFIINLIFIWI